MSQRSNKRENRRKRAHRIIHPRNGYSTRLSYIDEIIGTDFSDLLDEMGFTSDDRVKLAEFQGYVTHYNGGDIKPYDPDPILWRQANPIQGEVVKHNDDGRVGPD